MPVDHVAPDRAHEVARGAIGTIVRAVLLAYPKVDDGLPLLILQADTHAVVPVHFVHGMPARPATTGLGSTQAIQRTADHTHTLIRRRCTEATGDCPPPRGLVTVDANMVTALVRDLNRPDGARPREQAIGLDHQLIADDMEFVER